MVVVVVVVVVMVADVDTDVVEVVIIIIILKIPRKIIIRSSKMKRITIIPTKRENTQVLPRVVKMFVIDVAQKGTGLYFAVFLNICAIYIKHP